MFIRCASFCLALLLGGCANLATIDRRSSLEGGGTAVHLDAAQRLVYSKEGVLCAEPTPDALQSLASSTGIGLSQPSQGAISLANAFGANAASVGLHTQSITLMRDQLYRICEQTYNGKLVRGDVVQLLERSQDLTLGILAIEQLTGAVVARQALVTSESNASASANIANTQTQLDRAQKTEDDKKAALDKAKDEQTAAQDALKKSNDALDAAKKATPATPQADLDKLTAQQKTDQAAADKADKAVKTATADSDTAQKATQAIRDNLNAAITSASATAKGSGQLSPDDNVRNNISKDTVAEIAKAATTIVSLVTNKGHLLDTCMNLMVAYAEQSDPGKKAALSAPSAQCSAVITAYLKKYGDSLGAGTLSQPTPSPNPVTQPLF